jgi:hypothetical protein
MHETCEIFYILVEIFNFLGGELVYSLSEDRIKLSYTIRRYCNLLMITRVWNAVI